MSDIGTFIQFAGNGSYSVPVAASYDNSNLPGYEWNSESKTFDPSEVSAAGYTGALFTYLISEAFAQNSVCARPGKITTSAAYQSGKTCTKVGPLLCVDEASSKDNTAYFWSSATGRQYKIFGGAKSSTPIYSMLSVYTLVEAILPTLFDGAYNWTAASTSGGDVVSLNADWSLNFACLSVLPMYLAKGEECPVSEINGKCPFG